MRSLIEPWLARVCPSAPPRTRILVLCGMLAGILLVDSLLLRTLWSLLYG